MESKPLAVYDEFRAQIAELSAHNNSLVFDYATAAGNKEARSHIYKLRQTKAALDKARKAAKEESLEYGRRVDSEAKSIAEQLESMIAVHQKPLDEIEARETARVEKLKAALLVLEDSVRQMPLEWASLPPKHMEERLAGIEAQDFTEAFWQEFLTEALLLKDKAIAAIKDAIAKRAKYDSEQAELAKLRKQAEEQATKDRDARIASEAAERAKRDAEEKAAAEKRADELKVKRDKEAADKKLLEEKLRNERLEREKAEAEQRAKDAARETEERLKREAEAKKKKEADELAAREADKKHRTAVNKAVVAKFIEFGMTEKGALIALEAIVSKTVPHVTITY